MGNPCRLKGGIEHHPSPGQSSECLDEPVPNEGIQILPDHLRPHGLIGGMDCGGQISPALGGIERMHHVWADPWLRQGEAGMRTYSPVRSPGTAGAEGHQKVALLDHSIDRLHHRGSSRGRQRWNGCPTPALRIPCVPCSEPQCDPARATRRRMSGSSVPETARRRCSEHGLPTNPFLPPARDTGHRNDISPARPP